MAREFVKAIGLAEIQAALKALPAEIASKKGGPLRQGLAKGATVIRNEARKLAPVETGDLRDNIIIWRDKNPRADGHTEAYQILVRHRTAKKVVMKTYRDTKENRRKGRVGKEYMDRGSLFYAPMLEFGTVKMAARPYIRPAFESKKQEAVDTAVAHMRERIAAIAKKLNRTKARR